MCGSRHPCDSSETSHTRGLPKPGAYSCSMTSNSSLTECPSYIDAPWPTVVAAQDTRETLLMATRTYQQPRNAPVFARSEKAVSCLQAPVRKGKGMPGVKVAVAFIDRLPIYLLQMQFLLPGLPGLVRRTTSRVHAGGVQHIREGDFLPHLRLVGRLGKILPHR
jgi:hypothetical protein